MTVPVSFKVRDRGSTPRGMARRIGQMKREAWREAATLFHSQMRDKRFSPRHAREAGYTRRSRKYQMRKQRQFGHTRPLEFTGKARRDTRMARITATTNGARVAYAGARVFNFRNPKSQVNMVVEFTTITQSEADQLAVRFDRTLDQQLKADSQENS